MRKLFRTHLHLFSKQQGHAGPQKGQQGFITQQEQSGSSTDVRALADVVVEVQPVDAMSQPTAVVSNAMAGREGCTNSSAQSSSEDSSVTTSSTSTQGSEDAVVAAVAGVHEAVKRAVRGALYPRPGPVIAKAAAVARTVHEFDQAATIHWYVGLVLGGFLYLCTFCRTS
jgi:hypothetical protein